MASLDPRRRLLGPSIAASLWALGYAIYRAYYGLGGTLGLPGVLRTPGVWREVNLLGAGIILGAAMLPIVALPLWRRPRARTLLLGVAWLAFVGCVMHGVIDDAQRILSLAGIVEVRYPDVWRSVDAFAADVQDLAFNETWFIVEGLLWATLAWRVLGAGPARRWWFATSIAGIAALVAVGVLSLFDVVGRLVAL